MPESPHRRVVIYAPERLVRSLRAALALKGLTLSEWFRRCAERDSKRG